MSFLGVLSDSKYHKINKHEFAFYQHLYDTHPIVRAAAQTRSFSMYNGGVIIQRSNADISSAAIMPGDVAISDKQGTWLSEQYEKWGIMSDRNHVSGGICCTIGMPNKHGKMEMSLLDMTQVDLEYFIDPFGVSYWKVFVNVNETAYETNQRHYGRGVIDGRIELHDVMITVTSLPDRNGKINSIIKSLIPELMYGEALIKNSLQADRIRATPMIVTERQDDPRNRHVEYHGVGTPNDKGDGSRPHPKSIEGQYTDGEEQKYPVRCKDPMDGDVDAARVRLLNHAGQVEGRNAIAAVEQGIDELYKTTPNAHFAQQVELPMGRKIGKHTMPEGPSDHIAFRASLEERVFSAFGIPINMVKGKSSSSSQTSTGSANGNVQGSSGASNVEMIFTNSQKMLQKQTIRFMQELYRRFHATEDAYASVSKIYQRENNRYSREEKEWDKEQKVDEEKRDKEGTGKKRGRKAEMPFKSNFPSAEELNYNLDVSITIPSLPNISVLNQFYMDGILTYDGYKQYIANQYNIPMALLNSTPDMSLKDLNGVPPPKPPTASS